MTNYEQPALIVSKLLTITKVLNFNIIKRMSKTTIRLNRPVTKQDIEKARRAVKLFRPSSIMMVSPCLTEIIIQHEKTQSPLPTS